MCQYIGIREHAHLLVAKIRRCDTVASESKLRFLDKFSSGIVPEAKRDAEENEFPLTPGE
jgi:hypothetical protein